MRKLMGIKGWVAVLALLMAALTPGRASALSFVGDVDISSIFGPTGHSAEGIAYNTVSNTLFLTTSVGPSGKSTIYEITTGGSLLNSFYVPISRVKGVTFLPNGNMLLSNSAPAANGGGLFEYTKTGTAVPSGLNLINDAPSGDNDDVFFNAATNSLFVADDQDEAIYEFSLAGALLNTINTKAVDIKFNDPEGVAVDPITGNLYVADASKGTRALYELTSTGLLVQKIDFVSMGYLDPEGIAIDPTNGLLYVADDNAQKLVIFSTGSTHSGGGTTSHAAMPEPTTAVMGLMALAGAGAAMRRRRFA